MIQVTYDIPFTPGVNLATQTNQAAAVVLNQGELTLLGLTIAADNTAYNPGPGVIQRVVQFTEGPQAVAIVGLPVTNAKRKALVRGLFSYKLTLRLKKQVAEAIVLF